MCPLASAYMRVREGERESGRERRGRERERWLARAGGGDTTVDIFVTSM